MVGDRVNFIISSVPGKVEYSFLLVCIFFCFGVEVNSPFSLGVEINTPFDGVCVLLLPLFFGMSCVFPGFRLSHPPHVKALFGFVTSRGR